MSVTNQTVLRISQVVERPSPANLAEYLPYACGQLRAPFCLKVETNLQDEYVSVKPDDKSKKSKKAIAVLTQQSSSKKLLDNSFSPEVLEDLESEYIKLMATFNTGGQLIKITLNRCRNTPRMIFQIIGLCVSFSTCLTSLVINHCVVSGTILYEIAKFLPESQITEVCLDDTFVAAGERCYYMLLNRPTKLTNLSIARCNLTDNEVNTLFAQLLHPMPAAKTLIVLNLSGNFISDVGAHVIGNCLRSNRTLQYLNLAGNKICDDGAAEIFRSLVEFPLTADEIYGKRKRLVEFSKMRQEILKKFYKEISTATADKSLEDSKRITKRIRGLSITVRGTSSKNVLTSKAEAMTEDFVGRYTDPFSNAETFYRDKYLYCIGNMSLYCLNLAYNNLSYPSLQKLTEVLKYQSLVSSGKEGLMYVQIEGNDLPVCTETAVLFNSLEQAVMSRMTQVLTPRRCTKLKK